MLQLVIGIWSREPAPFAGGVIGPWSFLSGGFSRTRRESRCSSRFFLPLPEPVHAAFDAYRSTLYRLMHDPQFPLCRHEGIV